MCCCSLQVAWCTAVGSIIHDACAAAACLAQSACAIDRAKSYLVLPSVLQSCRLMYDLPSGEADVSGTLVDLIDDEDLEMMWEELDVMLVSHSQPFTVQPALARCWL